MTKKKVCIEIETDRPEVEYLLTSFENTCTEYGIKYKLSSNDWHLNAKYGTGEEEK